MTDGSDAPIFIIGSERSGSNLVRAVLDTHSRIAVPHPPHLVRYLKPFERSYGDLRRRDRRERLVRDAVGLIERHIHPWPLRCDVARAVDEAHPSVVGVSAALYDQYREHRGAARWGCKSTFMVAHVDETLALRPRAKFLWLVRDPRDVAVSATRAVFGPSHPTLMAELWRAEQEQARRARERWGPDTVHLFRYEDLVREPVAVLEGLCDFLGERVEPGMYEHHTTPAARETASLSRSWAMVGSPIQASSVGSYRRSLDGRDLAEIAQRAGVCAGELGYDLTAPATGAPRARWRLRASAARTRLGIEYRSWRQDDNFALRMRRDLYVRALAVRAALRGLSGRAQRRTTTIRERERA